MDRAVTHIGQWFCQAAIFLGAALLFQIQPLIAKRILPWFGAASAVWTTSILFFQSALLVGYLYAHGLTRQKLRSFVIWAHSGVLIASLLMLPVFPSDAWKPNPHQNPTTRILVLLTCTVGLPYMLLASTSTLLQTLWTRRDANDPPYRWYALSNAGSLAGLLSYPFLVEPLLGLRVQSYLWSGTYAIYIVLMLTTLLLALRATGVQQASGLVADARLSWIALPAVSSMLVLAVTSYLCENIAPVPFLWVLPLTAYLLSFVVSFAKDRSWNKILLFSLAAAGLLAFSILAFDPFLTYQLPLALTLATAGVFLVSLYLHRQVYETRPPVAALSRFYLSIAAGGAMGAFAAAFLAPLLFRIPIDFVVAISLSAIAIAANEWRERSTLRHFAAAVTMIVLFISGRYVNALVEGNHSFRRNFYGTLRVGEESLPNRSTRVRFLTHGLVRHGSQILDARLQGMPTMYYAYGTGVSLALLATARQGQRVGVVGLGTGTLAAYARPGDYYRFYEINPAVEQIAKSQFTYLRDSPGRIDIVTGDARLSLERETPQQFDVLVLDAFSSDAIPAHLLTVEAIRIYLSHLSTDGILAFNTTNRALDLESLLAALATASALHGCIINTGENPALQRASATWVLLSSNKELCSSPKLAAVASPLVNNASVHAWTDDHTSLWPILDPQLE